MIMLLLMEIVVVFMGVMVTAVLTAHQTSTLVAPSVLPPQTRTGPPLALR
jgi:hypothetical protein